MDHELQQLQGETVTGDESPRLGKSKPQSSSDGDSGVGENEAFFTESPASEEETHHSAVVTTPLPPSPDQGEREL